MQGLEKMLDIIAFIQAVRDLPRIDRSTAKNTEMRTLLHLLLCRPLFSSQVRFVYLKPHTHWTRLETSAPKLAVFCLQLSSFRSLHNT